MTNRNTILNNEIENLYRKSMYTFVYICYEFVYLFFTLVVLRSFRNSSLGYLPHLMETLNFLGIVLKMFVCTYVWSVVCIDCSQ